MLLHSNVLAQDLCGVAIKPKFFASAAGECSSDSAWRLTFLQLRYRMVSKKACRSKVARECKNCFADVAPRRGCITVAQRVSTGKNEEISFLAAAGAFRQSVLDRSSHDVGL